MTSTAAPRPARDDAHTRAQRVSISTDLVAQGDRHAFWADLVCDRLVQADCTEVPLPERFNGHIDQCLLGPLRAAGAPISVSRIRSDAQRIRRTKRHVAGARDECVLVNIQRSGVGRVGQDGREAVLLPGDMAVYTSDRPYELDFKAAFEQTVLILPAQAVRPWVPSLRHHTARRIPAAAPVASLLRHAAQQAVQGVASAAQPALEQALVHLLAASLAELSGDDAAGLRWQQDAGARPATQRCGRSTYAPDALSPREAEVLDLLARGLSYADMAPHLGLSVTTVRSHVRGLYAKLGVHNKTEAVFEARQWGWLA